MSDRERLHAGSAARLLETGRWLPPHAAADALGIALDELRRRLRRRELRSKAVGPSATLIEVSK